MRNLMKVLYQFERFDLLFAVLRDKELSLLRAQVMSCFIVASTIQLRIVCVFVSGDKFIRESASVAFALE